MKKILSIIILLAVLFTSSAIAIPVMAEDGEFFYDKTNFNTLDLTEKDGFSLNSDGNLELTLRALANEGSTLSLGGEGVSGKKVQFKVVYQSTAQGDTQVAHVFDVGGMFKIAKTNKNQARLDLGSGNKEYSDAFSIQYSDTQKYYYTMIGEINTETGDIKYGWWKKADLAQAKAINDVTTTGSKIDGTEGTKLASAGTSLTDVVLKTKPYQNFTTEATIVIHEISLNNITFEDTYATEIADWNEYKALGITSIDDITKANAGIVIAGVDAGKVLYEAGYAGITEAEYNGLDLLKAKAVAVNSEFFYDKTNFNTLDLTGKAGFSLNNDGDLQMDIQSATNTGSTLSLGGEGLTGENVRFKVVYKPTALSKDIVASLIDVGGAFGVVKLANNAGRIDYSGSSLQNTNNAFQVNYNDIQFYNTILVDLNTITGKMEMGWWQVRSIEDALAVDDMNAFETEKYRKAYIDDVSSKLAAGTSLGDVVLKTIPYTAATPSSQIVIHQISLDNITFEDTYATEIADWNEYKALNITSADDVTKANADIVIKGAAAGKTLLDAGYDKIIAEEITNADILKAVAEIVKREFLYDKTNFNTIDLTDKDGFTLNKDGNLVMNIRTATSAGSELVLGGNGLTGDNVRFKVVYQSTMGGKAGVSPLINVGDAFKVIKNTDKLGRLSFGNSTAIENPYNAFQVNTEAIIIYYTIMADIDTTTGEIEYGWWEKTSLKEAMEVKYFDDADRRKYYGTEMSLASVGTALTDIILNTKPYQNFAEDDAAQLVIHEVSLDAMTFEEEYAERIAELRVFVASDEFKTENITKDNAESIIDKCDKAIALYNAGYTGTETTVAELELLKATAEKLLNVVGEIVYATPIFSKDGENVKAVFTMKNTTTTDDNYTLIIAVYGANNKLLNITSKSTATLLKSTAYFEDNISIKAVEDAVSYKAYCWDNLYNCKPLACGEITATELNQ